ncbi:MAG TPA: thiamine-phosphate kinase, partial [Actinomycetes bacterium]|nr:thiamine-phosphate kinase [Actinomycetes bacterium]
MGDDAAVLAPTPGHKLVVTTDVLVEGLDFTAGLSEPEDWGWKAVAVNLSDLAAMGAEARWLVLALTVPEATPVATLERIYAGVGEACRAYGAALVGGDISGGPALSLAVTALGEAERAVRRSGARPGDRLCVT